MSDPDSIASEATQHENELFQLATSGDAPGVARVLASFSTLGEDGQSILAMLSTALCRTSLSQDKELALSKLLVEHRHLTSNWQTIACNTMMRASYSGKFHLVRSLLQSDPSLIDAPTAAGALCSAARREHPRIARYLLDHGADPNASAPREQEVSAMWYAVVNLDLSMMDLLHARGADPQGGSQHLLQTVAYGAQVASAKVPGIPSQLSEIVRRLLDWGVDPNDPRSPVVEFPDSPTNQRIKQTVAQWQAEQMEQWSSSPSKRKSSARL